MIKKNMLGGEAWVVKRKVVKGKCVVNFKVPTNKDEATPMNLNVHGAFIINIVLLNS